MRTINGEEYATKVVDVICESLENALYSAFIDITRELGCIEDYDEREKQAINVVGSFQYGCEATWRDQAIEMFEHWGMDVQPDGKEW